ncbi:MAG: O-antigen ligase family protein [Lacunisphaera sp.]
MPSATHDPFSPLVRILALGGLAGLAALTLADPGATRMWSMPWTCVLAFVLLAPGLILVLRAAAPEHPLRLPSAGWLAVALATAAVPLASALASPYRAPSLLGAAVPVSAAALFLALQDWLGAVPERNRLLLAKFLAGLFGVISAASFLLWLGDVAALSRAELFSASLFAMRNPHPLGHSNYTAGLMLLGLPWLLLAAWRDRGWARGLAAGGAGLALFNLFMSGSRGGLLGFAALGIANVTVMRLGWKRLLLVALGAVALATLLAVANPRIRSFLQPADPAAEPNLSTVQRSAMAAAGSLLGRDRPLLGWGPGTTPLAYPRYRQALAGGAENVLQLHNTPLQLWAETGTAGLLAALGLAVLVAGHWRREPVAAITLAGYGVFALTDYQLDVPVFAAAVAALAALLIPSASGPASARARGLVAAMTVLAIGLIAGFGGRDRAPALNTEALALARDPVQHDRAVALLRQSLTLNPNQEIAHFNLGWLLLVPDPATAEKHFLAAAYLVPDKGGVYFGLGLARLNQGRNQAAARAFALECVNEPLFLASPWWNVPAIAAQRKEAAAAYDSLLSGIALKPQNPSFNQWWETQAVRLRTLAPRLGQVSAGPEKNYRRERIGYPVLMRNLDLPVPTDLYDVCEDPRFPASVPFPLPSKGWLPSPQLLTLLDQTLTLP